MEPLDDVRLLVLTEERGELVQNFSSHLLRLCSVVEQASNRQADQTNVFLVAESFYAQSSAEYQKIASIHLLFEHLRKTETEIQRKFQISFQDLQHKLKDTHSRQVLNRAYSGAERTALKEFVRFERDKV